MAITIGVDAHKHTLTAVAVDPVGIHLAHTTVSADPSGIAALVTWAQQFQLRRWAIEDCRHVTVHLETALVAADEPAVRVPPHLTGPARHTQRTYGKSDVIDAEAVARACLAVDGDLPQVTTTHPNIVDLQQLVTYRTQAVHARTELINRLRWSLHQFDPTWSPPNLTSLKQLAAVHHRLTHHNTVAADLTQRVTERITTLTTDINHVTTQIRDRITTLAPALIAIEGCGPVLAAVIVTRVGDITRFPTEAQFGRYCGVAPIPASSGTTNRHRYHRGGDRTLNHAIHLISITQTRYHPPAQTFLTKKQHEGKTPTEARRTHKRHITRRIYQALHHTQLT